jgi:hypothetical protein
MRDLDALLDSLIKVDRESLIAILDSEAQHAQRLVKSSRQRTASQRRKRQEAIERAARIDKILSFVRYGETSPDISEADLALCKSLEKKLRANQRS